MEGLRADHRRLFVQAVLNEGRLDLIDELVGDDYVVHVPDAEECVFGPQALRLLVASRRSACPDLHVRILDQVAEADRVATRWQATSRTRPAGESVRSCEGISIVRLLAGKQVDSYTEYTAPTCEAADGRASGQQAHAIKLAGRPFEEDERRASGWDRSSRTSAFRTAVLRPPLCAFASRWRCRRRSPDVSRPPQHGSPG